jgi:hypothetical protein
MVPVGFFRFLLGMSKPDKTFQAQFCFFLENELVGRISNNSCGRATLAALLREITERTAIRRPEAGIL